MKLLNNERKLASCAATAALVPWSKAGEGGREPSADFADVEFPEAGGTGGRLHITTLRLIFNAHPANFVRGQLSVPLDLVWSARRWRSGLAVGIEVETPVAVHQYVSWSRGKILAALGQARAEFGDEQRVALAPLREAVSRWGPDGDVRSVDPTVREFLGITGDEPSLNEFLTLHAFALPAPGMAPPS